jgi:predicted transcriptional regulator
MPTERANDLYALKCFIDAQLATETVLTVDEVLARWNYENESEEREDRLEAIRRGFADVEAGRVRPAREAVNELRRKHNLPVRDLEGQTLSGSVHRPGNVVTILSIRAPGEKPVKAKDVRF